MRFITTLITNTHFEHFRLFLNQEKKLKIHSCLIFISHKQRANSNILAFKKLLTECEIIEIPKGEINFSDFKRNPQSIRKLIKEYQKIINHEGSRISHFDGYITFCDKTIFDQLWINRCSEKKLQIMAIDEGLGFYSKRLFSDTLRSFLYQLITPFMFGERLRYHKVLGRDKRIDCVYLKYPDLFPNERNIAVKKLIVPNSGTKGIAKPNKNALIFTSILVEHKVISEDKNSRIISYICSLLTSLGYEVFIKPHPSEVNPEKKYPFLERANLLTESDKISFFEFKVLIHFNSTLLLDMIEQGIPKQNIFTIIRAKYSKRVNHIINRSIAIRLENNSFDEKEISRRLRAELKH